MKDSKKYIKRYNFITNLLILVVAIMYFVIIVDGFDLILGFGFGIKLNDGMYYLFWPLI